MVKGAIKFGLFLNIVPTISQVGWRFVVPPKLRRIEIYRHTEEIVYTVYYAVPEIISLKI